MKIVFFGTPPFSARILDDLIQSGWEVVAVVTRPDKPKGRSQKTQPSAVKSLCLEKYPTIPLFSPLKASASEFAATLKHFDPDVFVVVAYGEIIKQNLLDLPCLLPVNVHTSLLPKYRGAAPMQRAIMNGEAETGVTIMEMVLEMDAGPILNSATLPIGEEATYGELEQALSVLSSRTLLETLNSLEKGVIQKIPQNALDATFAKKIGLEDRMINWECSAQAIHNQVRGLSPFPGAFALVEIDGGYKRLGIKRTKRLDCSGPAGVTISATPTEWVVGCKTGAISLLEVQLEGKKKLDIKSFLRGWQIPPVIKKD